MHSFSTLWPSEPVPAPTSAAVTTDTDVHTFGPERPVRLCSSRLRPAVGRWQSIPSLGE